MATLTWRRPGTGDYSRIIAVLDSWWGGRSMTAMVPRLFLDHFADTSYVVDDEQGSLVGFIIAFASPADPETMYVHFIGVDPDWRGSGLGRELYERVARDARASGRRRLAAVTSSANTASQAFHAALGFELGPVVPNYDGPGEDRVPLSLHLR